MQAKAALTARQAGRPDYVILALLALLLGVGIQAVYSASFALGLSDYDNAAYFVVRQGIWMVIGTVLMLVGMRIDYHRWKSLSPLLMLAVVVALVLVAVLGFGSSRYGATRSLNLAGLSVQPSEFAKLALIIYVSAWLASRGDKVRQFTSGVIPFVLIVGLVGGLVVMQPDLGTAVIIGVTTLTIFFLGGADLKHFALLVLAGLLAGAMLMLGTDYRSSRWEAFLYAEQDPAGKGFHILQLLIALGSGGILGLGPGASRQKFFYVPASHTDGIFAIIGEELGWVGALVILGLFVALTYRGFKIAVAAPDKFGALLAAGITCWIAFQALINIGGITRSIPFTGVPLPFISYGGSSLAALMAAMGILINVSKHKGQSAK